MFRFWKLKFLFVLVIIVTMADVLWPMDWTATNQVTLAWTPVATLMDGSAIPAGDVVSYGIFIVPETGDKLSDKVKMGETGDAHFVITFETEGRFFVGVSAKRFKDENMISYSSVSWSDNPVVVKDGMVFGIIYFRAPVGVLGLEVKGFGN